MIGKTMKCLVAVVAIMMTLGGVTAQTWTSGDCTVTLENGVLTVSGNGSMAHYNGSGDIPWYDSREQVTSIVVSNGVTNIGVRAFIGCSNATTLSLPNTLTSIGLMAFLRCTGLTDITLPNSLTSIQESAFMDCTGLTSITLPNSVTTIKEGLFEGCTGLTTVTLPSSVTKIEERAFYNCSAVTDVYLAANPANLTWENEWYGSVYNDFKENGTTLCHVPSQYYEAYVANFSHINVIFVEEGQMSWQSGDCTVTFEVGETVKIGYIDQQHAEIDPEKSVYEMISGGNENLQVGGRLVNSRAYISRFNFSGTDQSKKVGVLSGGERNRLHLALTLKSEANVLLLDEPTNDIDVNTMRALEEGLENFAGCAVVISHDRWFLDRICTHILAFEGDSQVYFFEGGYTEYEENRKKRLGDDTPHRIHYKKLKA